MSLSLVKTATLSALMMAASTVPAFAADTMQDWAEEVRKEFAQKHRYPARAQKANAEGTVKVRVRVANTGSIKGFEIIQPSGSDVLDAEALDLIARVDPLPALPVEDENYAFVIPLSFKLQDAGADAEGVTLERAATDMNQWRQSVERQVARRQAYPDYLINRGVEGQVKLRLDVAADGSVVESHVLQSSGHQELDEEALLMASDLSLPKLPEGKDAFTVVLPLKYEIAKEEDSAFVRR